MSQKINIKKIATFIAINYSFCITIYIILKMINLDFSDRITAFVVAFVYMPTPAISAFIVQKLIYKDKLQKLGLSFYKNTLKNFLLIILIMLSIILITTLIIYLFGNLDIIENFGKLNFSEDFFKSNILDLLKEKGIDKTKSHIILNLISGINPIIIYFFLLIEGILIGGIFNIPFVFGEEFGWRGFLLNETKPLGFWKSSLIIGIIWGIWHIPLVLLGLNFSDHPYLGCIIMIIFTISLSPLFMYARLKTKSILGRCLLHGMINGTAGIFTYFVSDSNELLSTLPGFAGIFSIIIVSIIVFLKDKKFTENYAKYFDN